MTGLIAIGAHVWSSSSDGTLRLWPAVGSGGAPGAAAGTRRCVRQLNGGGRLGALAPVGDSVWVACGPAVAIFDARPDGQSAARSTGRSSASAHHGGLPDHRDEELDSAHSVGLCRRELVGLKLGPKAGGKATIKAAHAGAVTQVPVPEQADGLWAVRVEETRVVWTARIV